MYFFIDFKWKGCYIGNQPPKKEQSMSGNPKNLKNHQNQKQAGGYHLKPITRGVLGELSKISEELEEAYDAEAQGVKIMLLVELSDMIGAIKAVAEKNGSSLEDLIKMQQVTERAFKTGARK